MLQLVSCSQRKSRSVFSALTPKIVCILLSSFRPSPLYAPKILNWCKSKLLGVKEFDYKFWCIHRNWNECCVCIFKKYCSFYAKKCKNLVYSLEMLLYKACSSVKQRQQTQESEQKKRINSWGYTVERLFKGTFFYLWTVILKNFHFYWSDILFLVLFCEKVHTGQAPQFNFSFYRNPYALLLFKRLNH